MGGVSERRQEHVRHERLNQKTRRLVGNIKKGKIKKGGLQRYTYQRKKGCESTRWPLNQNFKRNETANKGCEGDISEKQQKKEEGKREWGEKKIKKGATFIIVEVHAQKEKSPIAYTRKQ